MIQDLHSHTYYSFCGEDKPETVIEAAIAGGICLFGICDHNYGVGLSRPDVFSCTSDEIGGDYYRNLTRYFDHLTLLRDRYAGQIRLLRGLEIATRTGGRYALPENQDVSFFDYCMLEHLDFDAAQTVTHRDLFAYAARCGCPVGVAHTDLFSFIEAEKQDPYEFFVRMRQAGIFWEMNVSFDSIHGYHQHPYMLRFFEDAEQQAIVRRSGVRLSVGFDGHRVGDYLPERVRDYCRRVEDMGIPMAFEEQFAKEGTLL